MDIVLGGWICVPALGSTPKVGMISELQNKNRSPDPFR